jgi:hypothetical protein
MLISPLHSGPYPYDLFSFGYCVGTCTFFGDVHQDTAQGKVIAE